MRESTKLFLENDRVESDFYSTTKENLVSLREYLEALKIMDKKFMYLASEEISIIKSELDWFDSISFFGMENQEDSGYFLTSLHIYTKDKDEYIVSRNKETSLYEDLAKDIPKIYLLNPRIRKHIERMKDLKRIQPELREIENVGRYIYNDCLDTKNSISGAFEINYAPRLGMLVTSEHETIATLYERKTKHKDKTYLDEKSQSKLLDIIQMKRRDLPDINRQTVVAVSPFSSREQFERSLNLKRN
ncbi:MAG: hypothetical protein IKF37_00010 [Bacilli bacterium]|nr:hypothetical protein [Bacilli bacterium]